MGYNNVDIEQTETYRRWFAKLRDRTARAKIDLRIKRLAHGNPGDVRFVGEGVLELKIDHGPGYRVYYIRRAVQVILLLAGGDKPTQTSDIHAAIDLAARFRSAK